MRKATLNFVVDATAFVAFVVLAATGVLVRYVLPPGSGHFRTLWGMDRHEWGQLHFWVAVALLVSLALHVFLHWRWVVAMVCGRSRDGTGSGLRIGLALVALLALAGLVALPFVGPIEQTDEAPHHLRSTEHVQTEGPRIEGSMTLAELEQETGVPAAVVLRELGIDGAIAPDTRLGRLRKEHGFEMHDVRAIVERHETEP